MADYNETETEMAKPDVNADGRGDSAATTEESRDVKEGGDSTLTIRFRDQTGEEVNENEPHEIQNSNILTGMQLIRCYYVVKRSTKMQKVFTAYASRKGVETESLRFLLDGERVLGTQTPEDLDLEDQDQIDCMLEQQGGWCQV